MKKCAGNTAISHKIEFPPARPGRFDPESRPRGHEQIVQDATLLATRMMDSADKTITTGNASYYAALRHELEVGPDLGRR